MGPWEFFITCWAVRVVLWLLGLFCVWLLYTLLRDNRSIRVTEHFLQVLTPLSLGILDLNYALPDLKLVEFKRVKRSGKVMIIETNKSHKTKRVRLHISNSNILNLIDKLKASGVDVQNALDI